MAVERETIVVDQIYLDANDDFRFNVYKIKIKNKKMCFVLFYLKLCRINSIWEQMRNDFRRVRLFRF